MNKPNRGRKKNGWQFALPAISIEGNKPRLPVSAAVTSTTVESTTTAAHCASFVEAAATAVERITATRYVPTTETRVAVESAISMVPTAAMVPVITAVVTAAIIPVTIEAMEPRAGTDENSVHEVIRAPVAIGRTRVRSIRVVAISAHRRRADGNSYGTNSDSHSDPNLSARNGAHRKNQNSKNCCIF